MTTATREAVYRRPPLYPKQRAAIYDPARFSIIEASTKSGKTIGCLVWLLEQAMVAPQGANVWWVAPVYAQAKIAYRRMKRGLPAELVVTNETELTILLGNGVTVWFKTADHPDNLYGEDVYAAVVDEATRCKEESWFAIRSTLTATRGSARIIGNVKGRKNWAYRLARRAEAGEPELAYHLITAHDAVAAGVLSPQEVEDAKRLLPDAVFRELYLAEPSDDEGNPFGIAAIRACIAPRSGDPPEVWGWDLAKSVDWTVGVGLDAEGRTSGFMRFQKPWQDTIRNIQAATGDVRALVDSTGVGDPVLEALQQGDGSFEGYKFTAASKQQLMEGLAVAIQQRQVSYPEGPIATELEAFEYVYTRTGVHYSAPEGMTDDCVCALALAVQHRRGGTGNIRFLEW